MSDSFSDGSKKEPPKKPPAKPEGEQKAADAGAKPTGPLPNPAGAAANPPSTPARYNPMAGKVYGAYKPAAAPAKPGEAKPAEPPAATEEAPKEDEKPAEPTATIEMNDAFKRNRALGTARLGGGDPRTLGEMIARLEVAMGAVAPLVSQLEPRVEVMRRAFQEAGHEVPGVPKEEFKFELTPRMAKIQAYLTGAIKKTPGLARQMALAIFRFHETQKQLGQAKRAIERRDIPPTLHEALGQSHFHLSNFHEEFKTEQVLAQLFPAPAGADAKSVMAATKEVTREMKRALFEARRALIRNAHQLHVNAAPRIEVLAAALGFMDQIGGTGGFKPALAAARVLSLQFVGDKAAVTQMKKAVGFQERLGEQLERVKENPEDVNALQIVYDGYCDMVKAWDGMPALRDHLPLKVLPEHVEPEGTAEPEAEAQRQPWT